jgi:hypothetical protein
MRDVEIKAVHPALKLKVQSQPRSVTLADLRASFGAETERVSEMIGSLHEVFGVDFQLARVGREAKTAITHVVLIYRQDVWPMFFQEPVGELPDRLEQRGIRAQGSIVDGVHFVAVFWPTAEILGLTEIWHDLDAAGATVMQMTKVGLLCGTVQKF